MVVCIHIPSNLRPFSGGNSIVQVEANHVNQALELLVQSWPALRDRIYAEPSQLHSFINVFVGSRNIRDLNGLATALTDTQLTAPVELLIVPALAGG